MEERVKRSVYIPLVATRRRGRNNAEADRIDGRMGSDIKGRHEKLTEAEKERGRSKEICYATLDNLT